MLVVAINLASQRSEDGFWNALVCTPSDAVLTMFVGWFLCLILFRVYKRASEAIQRHTKYELMQASIEVVRLCDTIQTCLPDFAVKQIHDRRIQAAGMILALRDEGVPVGEYEIESVLQLAYGNGYKEIRDRTSPSDERKQS